MRITQLCQRLRDLGAKPCHEDRLLRGWSQAGSYDRPRSAAEGFWIAAIASLWLVAGMVTVYLNGVSRVRD